MPPPADIAATLDRIGQAHVLRFYDELGEASRRSLLAQVRALDLERIPDLVERYVRRKPEFEMPRDVEPAPYYPADPRRRAWDRAAYRAGGESLLREGKVGAFCVAGGQGSRLGFEGPKGCFAAGAVTGRLLFRFFAEGLLAAERKYGVPVAWYIMTSPLNHEDTIACFEREGYFGLDRANVMFFAQGVMPSFDARTGRILLAAKDAIATNPDGHGGSLKALWVSGAVADMRRRGIEHVSYFQVDNPIVRFLDPVFLGLHALAPDSSGEMSSKMIPKAYPGEKLGVFCRAGGRLRVIEYSDLPVDLQNQRLPDGTLRFAAGSIAVHVLGVEFVARLNTDPAFSLPFHRADKKVACIDAENGALIEPAGNNGVKLEMFVFDALPLCRNSIVLETDRVEEFAPIKNATGVDSVESSREIQTERAARWLEARGVKVARTPEGKPDCTIEVSPLTAVEAGDLEGRQLPRTIERGARIVL